MIRRDHCSRLCRLEVARSVGCTVGHGIFKFVVEFLRSCVLGLVVFVQALANDEMLVVGRFFFFFSKSGSRCLFGGSQWLVVAYCGFLEPGEAWRFLLPSLPVAHDVHSSHINVLRQYPAPTTVFILPILLLQELCFYRTTHDLGLGVQLLVLHPESAPLQRRTHVATATAATATTIEEAVLGYASHICCNSSLLMKAPVEPQQHRQPNCTT